MIVREACQDWQIESELSPAFSSDFPFKLGRMFSQQVLRYEKSQICRKGKSNVRE